MKKLKFVANGIVVGALMTGLLTGCAANADTAGTINTDSSSTNVEESASLTESNAPAEEIVIKFYWANIETSQQDVWEKYVFAPFIEKHPEVTIDAQYIPDLQNTLRVQLAAGAGPDIFYIDGTDIPEYTAAGMLMELDSYREQYKLDDFLFDYALKTGEYNGHLYGIPHSIEAACMTYNKTLIDELGQVVPKTREEYESLCNAAQEAGYLPISFGYSGNTIFNGWAWDHYIATYAGVEKEKQLLKGEITFNDPEIRASFEQLKADWDKGWINDKKSGAISLDEARALFSNGKAAMNMEGGWSTLADNLQKNWDFEWGQAEWPSMKNGTPPSAGISIGEYIGINAKSKYAELCAEMMCDFYMDEQRVADAVSNGFSTPCREIDPNLYPEDMDPGIKQALEYQNELLGGENLSYHAFSFWPSKTLNYLNDNLDKLFYDQISMDDFLNQAQEKIETDFDNGYLFKG